LVWDKGSDASVPGLHVLISKHGVKTYRSHYRYPGEAKRHSRALGRVGVMTLAEAREACRMDQRKAFLGHDPKKQSPTNSVIFKGAVEEYATRVQSKNATGREAIRTMLNYTTAWHKSPLATIRPEQIQLMLEGIMNCDPANALE